MKSIKCSNKDCEHHSNPFSWDETDKISKGCDIDSKFHHGAETIIIECPQCETEMTFYVVCPSGSDPISRIGENLRKGISKESIWIGGDDRVDIKL